MGLSTCTGVSLFAKACGLSPCTGGQTMIYRISSVIRQSFFLPKPKVLDPSCKTDLELWHCLGRVELVL